MDIKQITGTDIETLNKWYKEWDQPTVLPKMLPATGFIVPNIAAGFIYFTDSSIALIEGYISNPAASKQLCDKALDMITEALLTQALIKGYTEVMAFTKNTAIERRAKSWGFKEEGVYKLLIKGME